MGKQVRALMGGGATPRGGQGPLMMARVGNMSMGHVCAKKECAPAPSPPCPGPCCLLTAKACCVQVASQGTNSQGSSYTNYSDGGYRYSNSNGSSYYSPSGNGAGFYNGGSSGNQSFYGRSDGSRKYFSDTSEEDSD